MSQSPQEEGAINATTARNKLYSLVKLVEEEGRTTVITKHKVRALLAPLDRLPAARKTDAFPAHVLSTAQRDFGDLVTLAAKKLCHILFSQVTGARKMVVILFAVRLGVDGRR
ncbi:hypothetical protein ABZS89_43920, partial [Streptomyces sp. NPDC005407]